MVEKAMESVCARFMQSQAVKALSERLRKELASDPPDEGEVFSILDLLYYSLETEENMYMGDIGLRVSSTLIDTLCSADREFGKGLLRPVKLFFLGYFYLKQLLKHARELRSSIGMCAAMAGRVKYTQIVLFVEESGATVATPVIQKWLDARRVKISPTEWKRLKASAAKNEG